MRLEHEEEPQGRSLAQEPRYDRETLTKVTRLAQQLQARQDGTVTAREMEEIGEEVGLDRSFMRRALDELTRSAPGRAIATPGGEEHPRFKPTAAGMAAWWSAGWTLPFVFTMTNHGLGMPEGFVALSFFMGWAVYIGGGVWGSTIVETEKQAQKQAQKHGLKQARRGESASLPALDNAGSVSRATLLELVDLLQRELEGQKEHRAFLSVDVVGSSEMKRTGQELAVEYSFRQFNAWIMDAVRACGGDVQSAAGDGMMAVFERDEDAVRAARRIQLSMARFNANHNRLTMPFRVRCGISAGEVAVDRNLPIGQLHSPVIDRAAALQRQAAPGGVVVGAELHTSAREALGPMAPVGDPVTGETAYAWWDEMIPGG